MVLLIKEQVGFEENQKSLTQNNDYKDRHSKANNQKLAKR